MSSHTVEFAFAPGDFIAIERLDIESAMVTGVMELRGGRKLYLVEWEFCSQIHRAEMIEEDLRLLTDEEAPNAD